MRRDKFSANIKQNECNQLLHFQPLFDAVSGGTPPGTRHFCGKPPFSRQFRHSGVSRDTYWKQGTSIRPDVRAVNMQGRGVYWYIIGSVTCSTNPDRRGSRVRRGGRRRGREGPDGLPGPTCQTQDGSAIFELLESQAVVEHDSLAMAMGDGFWGLR